MSVSYAPVSLGVLGGHVTSDFLFLCFNQKNGEVRVSSL